MTIFTEFKGTSEKDSLNLHDIKRVVRNFFIFSIPTIVAVLIALQGFITNDNNLPSKTQIIFAIGAGYQALLASLIDVLQKYKR